MNIIYITNVMDARRNITSVIENFDEIISRIKCLKSFTDDSEVAEWLGFKQSTFAMRKKRGKIPKKEIILAAMREGINPDQILSDENTGRMLESILDTDTLYESQAPLGGIENTGPPAPIHVDLQKLIKTLARIGPAATSPEEKAEVKQLLALTEQILSSKNVMIREALKHNIIAFATSLELKYDNEETQKKLGEIMKRLSILEQKEKV